MSDEELTRLWAMANDRTDDRNLYLLCRAANCRRLADEAIDASAEKLFLQMARSYELLARRYAQHFADRSP